MVNNMHSQVLIIHPENMKIDDIMYPYQEIDKDIHGKMGDERCQFFLTVPEQEIPKLLIQMKAHMEKMKGAYLEMIQYRTNHTVEEFKEKYGGWYDCFKFYTMYCDDLSGYDKIKDLPWDNPEQISFIINLAGFAVGKWTDIYIKGMGYGTFHNPYELFDYYQEIPYIFGPGVHFLISKTGGRSNQMKLSELDIDETVININEWTMVWENIIFCPDDSADSKLYTTNDTRFSKKCNKHCLVDNLRDKLIEISNAPDKNYVVTALDFHW